jgi:hypothetical protein
MSTAEYVYVVKGAMVGDVFVGRCATLDRIPEGYVVQMVARVHDSVAVERLIMTQLKACQTLEHRPSIESYESFKGDIGTVASIVARTVAKLQADDTDDDDVIENPLISFMDMLSSI